MELLSTSCLVGAIVFMVLTLIDLVKPYYTWREQEAAEAPQRALKKAEDALVESIFDLIHSAEAAKFKTLKIYVSYATRNTYAKWCQRERRFYHTMKLEGGENALSIESIPLVPTTAIVGAFVLPIFAPLESH